MTQDLLAASEKFTLVGEEGQQSKPLEGDPGGDTNWGVTLAKLSEWRGQPCTADDVYGLTLEEAGAIFQGWCWNGLRCWDAWPGLGLMLSDHGFNRGLAAPARIVQTLLAVTVDCRIGPITAAAWNMVEDRAGFLLRLRVAQEADYRSLGNFARFGAEWVGDPAATDDWRQKGRLGRRYEAALALLNAA